MEGAEGGTSWNERCDEYSVMGSILLSEVQRSTVIRPLTAGTSINSSGVFGALGDAYINPFWADAEQMFPNGDSYIGTTFKIGSSKHYGWILVHVNNDVITIKKYAYNNVANQGITV